MDKNLTMRIGLISDTHMPERCFAFPSTLFDVFENVDFIEDWVSAIQSVSDIPSGIRDQLVAILKNRPGMDVDKS